MEYEDYFAHFYRLRKCGSERFSGQDHSCRASPLLTLVFNVALSLLWQQLTFCRAFCSFQGISDMSSIIQYTVQCILLFTNEEIEFQSICITGQDNTGGIRITFVFSPLTLYWFQVLGLFLSCFICALIPKILVKC